MGKGKEKGKGERRKEKGERGKEKRKGERDRRRGKGEGNEKVKGERVKGNENTEGFLR